MGTVTVGSLIKAAVLSKGGTEEEFDAEILSALAEAETQLLALGVEFDASSAYAKYTEIKADTVSEFLVRLRDAESGNIGDMPDGLDLAGELCYALINNFRFEDFVKIILRAAGIYGTSLDFTDPAADFTSVTVSGKFFEEGGKIYGGSAAYTAENGGENIQFTLTFNSSVPEDFIWPEN